MSLIQTLTEFFPPSPTFTETDLPDLEGRIYIVTGGAAGIGKQLVRMLYDANATIYIAGRSAANIEKAMSEIASGAGESEKDEKSARQLDQPSKGRLYPFVFDLADLPTIKPAVEELTKTLTHVDGLFLNAGVMRPPQGSQTVQGYELQWGTNVVGHFVLQQLLMPVLLRTASAKGDVRIVWTASDGHGFSPKPDGIAWNDVNDSANRLGAFALYGQSKAGNVLLAREAAVRYTQQGITSVALNPGHLKTDLQRHSSSSCLERAVSKVALYDARYGGLTLLFAGFAPEVDRERSGRYIIPWGRFGKLAGHVEEGLKKGSGKRLWDLLEKETAKWV